MNILVTGGAGFIGSRLASALLVRGDSVAAMDDLSRRGAASRLHALQRLGGRRFVHHDIDIRDASAVAGAARTAEAIFHFASQVAVTTSVEDPRTDFEVNALGTLNILEAARRSPHRPAVLFTSTNKVYGALDDLDVVEHETRYELPGLPHGVSEDRPLDLHSPYGCSKGAADQYVRDYSRIYGLPTVVFRMSCIYGPGQVGGEEQGWASHFLLAAMTGRPVTIYGNGKQTRDMLYVDDLVRAFSAALDAIDVTSGRIYNIGGGPQNAVGIWQEFSRMIPRLAGREPEATFAPARPGDQRVYVTDTRRALRDFGWRPTTPVAEGLDRTAAWLRSYLVPAAGAG